MSVPVPAEPAVPADAVAAVRDAITAQFAFEFGDPPDPLERILIQRLSTAAANAAAPAIRASERQHLTRAMNLDSAITQAATDLGIKAPEWRMAIFRELCAAVAVVAREDERELVFTETDAAIAKATADAAPAIRSAAIAEGVQLERQRTLDAASMPGYIRQQENRVTVLEQLARDILATFHFGAMHAHATAGAEQIAQWEATLKGQQ